MLKNLISTLFARGSVALLNLAILIVSSRQLGSSVFGQISLLILNIAIVQIINEIYTGYALVHYIPKFKLSRLYQSGLMWILLSTVVTNLALLLFNILVRDHPGLDPKDALENLWIHGLLLSFIITLHSFHCVILLAKQKIAAYNFLMLFQPLTLLTVLCLNIFVLGHKTADSYLIALYCSYGGSAILSAWQFIKVLKIAVQDQDTFKAGSVIKNGFVNQLGNLAHTLSNRYNYYLISGTALVGVYAGATSLIESVWIIGNSIAPIVLTHVANQKDVPNNSRVTFLLSKLSLLFSCLCVGVIMALPESFFTALLGKDFTSTKTLMLHLSPGILCISFSTVISHYFSGLGQQRTQLVANSAGLLVTICTSYFFISRYQLIGACYSASLSYFTASLILVIVFMKQQGFSFASLFSLRKDLFLLKK